MSTFKNNKNKTIAVGGIAAGFILILAIVIILLQDKPGIDETAEEDLEIVETTEDETDNEEIAIEETTTKKVKTEEKTTPKAEKTAPTDTLTTEESKPITTIPKPKTEEKVVPSSNQTMTLAPVSTLSEEVLEVMEEHNIDIVETQPIVQTTPPPTEQRAPDATTYIDGKKHVWHPDLGWCPAYRDGTVVVMDVESNGEQYEGGW